MQFTNINAGDVICRTITIADDDIVEGTEEFMLLLHSHSLMKELSLIIRLRPSQSSIPAVRNMCCFCIGI